MSYPTSDILETEIDNVDDVMAQHVNELRGASVNMALRHIVNASGATVTVGDVGYLDYRGVFKLTTTAYLDSVTWAVVIVGGIATADIVVAVGGSKIIVTLDGNCSVYDYLYTSGTTKQAKPQSYMRPEMFAIATTANTGGAGGTCEATLHCNTRPVAAVSATTIYAKNTAHSGSDFVSTINGAPGATTVVYGAVTSGNEEWIEPLASLGTKMRLYNSTRVNYALISSVNLGTNTITVSAAADIADWQNTDDITVRSPTNTGTSGVFRFSELQFNDAAIVPTLARSIILSATFRDSAAASEQLLTHPWQAYAGAAVAGLRTMVANIPNEAVLPDLPLLQRRFTIACTASGGGTITAQNFNLRGYNLATP